MDESVSSQNISKPKEKIKVHINSAILEFWPSI